VEKQMTRLPFYLSPQLARENLIASRLLNAARRIRKARVATTEAAFKRLGYDETAARELAQIHVERVL
jgi:hypothetical protein